MTLAALISAYQDAEPAVEGLRATLPLAGRTLVERQARLAASAGASPVIVLVERVPPNLLVAIDRLRSEGVAISLARTAVEAAQAIDGNDRLLLFADGFVADETHITRLLAAGGNALLTLPDRGVDDRFERIDAQSRWAGLAITTGATLRQTVSMLEDWDLQSTLLRKVVQAGARQFSVQGDLTNSHLTIVTSREDLVPIEAHILEGAIARRDNWVSRYLLGPAEQAVTRLLMPTVVAPDWLRSAGVGVTILSIFLFTQQWLWLGGAAMLVSTLLDDTADRLATLRMQGGGERSWISYLLPLCAGASLVALCYALAIFYGWGCLVLGGAILAFVTALWVEVGGRDIPGAVFLAERKGMIWVMLPFVLTGSWLSGIFALFLYSSGSFFWAQHHVHRHILGPLED